MKGKTGDKKYCDCDDMTIEELDDISILFKNMIKDIDISREVIRKIERMRSTAINEAYDDKTIKKLFIFVLIEVVVLLFITHKIPSCTTNVILSLKNYIFISVKEVMPSLSYPYSIIKSVSTWNNYLYIPIIIRTIIILFSITGICYFITLNSERRYINHEK